MSEVNANLTAEVKRLEDLVQNQIIALKSKELYLGKKEYSIRQNLVSNQAPQDVERNLKSALPGFLVPGNTGDINRVIWPFFFSNEPVEVAPNANIRTGFSVTQEAGFVIMSYTKAVYKRTFAPDGLAYIDPEVQPYADFGLKFTLNDPQSNRSFFNTPIQFQHIGDPKFPTVLPSPMLLLPNSNYELTFVNDHPTDTFVATLNFFGYRVRIDSAANILSTIYA